MRAPDRSPRKNPGPAGRGRHRVADEVEKASVTGIAVHSLNAHKHA